MQIEGAVERTKEEEYAIIAEYQGKNAKSPSF